LGSAAGVAEVDGLAAQLLSDVMPESARPGRAFLIKEPRDVGDLVVDPAKFAALLELVRTGVTVIPRSTPFR
jgi:hypothetical protein